MRHGILNCYKPTGLTSRDVVNRVYRQLKPSKVGHAGTLDPLACGVLVVVVGSASRLVRYLHQYSKTYRAEFLLGRSSDSHDIETEVRYHADDAAPTMKDLQEAARRLTGTISQTPPMYSAIKVGGRRAYDAARNAETLTIPERQVQIDRFAILEYEFPRVVAEIDCGTGTYIRTLGVDLAKLVGNHAVMSALTRTRIGPYSMDDALQLVDGAFAQPEKFLRPLAEAVQSLPSILMSQDETTEISHGRTIAVPSTFDLGELQEERAEIAAFAPDGQLRAIVEPRPGGLGPKRVFPDVGSHQAP